MVDETLVYVIDTCSIISLKDVQKEFFRPFWKSLGDLINADRLISPEEVLKELEPWDDSLYHWAERQPKLIKILDEKQVEKTKQIIKRFRSLADPNKVPAVADPFVIALSLVSTDQERLTKTKSRRVVVTEELATGNINGPKIPDVCRFYGIECINLDELLKREFEILIKLKTEENKI